MGSGCAVGCLKINWPYTFKSLQESFVLYNICSLHVFCMLVAPHDFDLADIFNLI